MESDTFSKVEAAQSKYLKTEKGKQALNRYSQSNKGKASKLRYSLSERGRTSQLKYKLSPKGKNTLEIEKGISKLITQYFKWLKGNPEGTQEQFFKEVGINVLP